MKKILSCISLFVLCFMAQVAFAQKVWYNPAEAQGNVVRGRTFVDQERDGFYHRFPSSVKSKVNKRVWGQSTRSAGENIVFRTNAKEITVRYTVKSSHAMPHMPAIGVSGVDMYSYDKNGNEVWVPGKYSFRDTVTYTFAPVEIANTRKGEKRFTLYLPLYNEVTWMEIGTEEGAKFRFEEEPATLPIVAYGSSICQGACASRPAMAWTNIVSRRLGHPVLNLGFSGLAYLEAPVIDVISEIDAKVYIIDAMPNACSMEYDQLRDTILQAVHQLRGKRAETPILLVDHLGYPHGKAYAKQRDMEKRAWDAMAEAYKTLQQEGVPHLFHLSHEAINLPADGTVEGVHPSDVGMVAYANAYEKILREILNEPVGSMHTQQPIVQQRDSYNWMDRHLSILKNTEKKHYTRIIFGDSIMHFWGGAPGAPAQRGTDTWEALPGESLNLGFGHDRVENLLWRVYHGEIDGVTADKVFIAIGTNNITAGSSDDEIAEGIAFFAKAVRARIPEAEITVMAVLPRRGREDRVEQLNVRLRAMAKENDLKFKDQGKAFLLKDGKVDESLFTDGLHPNGAGYQKIAKGFK